MYNFLEFNPSKLRVDSHLICEHQQPPPATVQSLQKSRKVKSEMLLHTLTLKKRRCKRKSWHKEVSRSRWRFGDERQLLWMWATMTRVCKQAWVMAGRTLRDGAVARSSWTGSRTNFKSLMNVSGRDAILQTGLNNKKKKKKSNTCEQEWPNVPLTHCDFFFFFFPTWCGLWPVRRFCCFKSNWSFNCN